MDASRLVTINQRQMDEVLAMLGGSARKLNVAMQAAISKTLRPTAVKMFSDRVKDTINLPVNEIKRQVTVKLPSFNNLVGSITMSRKPVPLLRYLGAKGFTRAQTLKIKVKGAQTRFRRTRVPGGISVKVRKDGPAEVYPSAFIAASTINGFIGIFQRVKNRGGPSISNVRAGPGDLVRRKPIRLFQGPTAVGVLAHAPGKNAETIIDEIKIALGPVLQRNVLSQIDRLLRAPNSFSKFSNYIGE